METDIRVLMSLANRTARDKGWWEGGRSFGDIIALIHSEASEALEAYREYREPARELSIIDFEDSEQGPISKPVGVASEFADILIRVFDACEELDIPLVEAIDEKMKFNARRPPRHGGKNL